jgi:hypothetical protein
MQRVDWPRAGVALLLGVATFMVLSGVVMLTRAHPRVVGAILMAVSVGIFIFLFYKGLK